MTAGGAAGVASHSAVLPPTCPAGPACLPSGHPPTHPPTSLPQCLADLEVDDKAGQHRSQA